MPRAIPLRGSGILGHDADGNHARLHRRPRTSCCAGCGGSRARSAGSRGWSQEDRYCIDVLTQIAAARAALDKVALGLLDDHAHHCVMGAAGRARARRQDRRADGRGRPLCAEPRPGGSPGCDAAARPRAARTARRASRRVVAQAGVDLGGLDHRARRRDQPAEALGLGHRRAPRRRPGRPRPRAPGARSWSRDARPTASVRARAPAAALGRARSAAPRKPPLAAEQHDADVEPLAALDARARRAGSRRRMGQPPARALLGLRSRSRRRPGAGAGSRRTRRPAVAGEPVVRAPAPTAAASAAARARRAAAASASAIEPARGQQHVVGDLRERPRGVRRRDPGRRAAGTARRRDRSATAARARRSRLGLRGVRSTLVVSASSHTISAASSGVGLPQRPAGRVGERAGQEVDAEVDRPRWR